MRVEDLTKFEGECPIIVVFSTYMDIRIPLTKKLIFESIKQNNFIMLENDIMQIKVGGITYI